MEEIWKDIDGYSGLYKVSNYGRVMSIVRGTSKMISFTKTKRGYFLASLYCNGRCKRHLVNRLVAIAFIPNPDRKPMVNHINAIRTDNSVGNLEWVTHLENVRHAVVNKLYASGDKWTPRVLPRGRWSQHRQLAQVKDGVIVAMFDTQHEAAARLGLDQGCISRVCSGEYPHTKGFQFKYIDTKAGEIAKEKQANFDAVQKKESVEV